MRRQLQNENGLRKAFIATFSKIGKKTNFNGYSEDTVLLTNVHDAESGQLMADHVWFTYSKSFQAARIIPGMVIRFEARIKEYKKGYVNPSLGMKKQRVDYKLSHPTKITIVSTTDRLKSDGD